MKKWLAICLLPLLAACATPHRMAIDHETKQLDLADKALVLMSVKMVNGYKPNFQPTPNVVFVEKPVVRGPVDRLNYVIDAESEQGGVYFIRMAIPAGKYVVRGIRGVSAHFLVVGSCLLPVHQDVNLKAGEVVYLGRVAGTIRERMDGELRAGSLLPLVDQAVTGFSGGTFDVLLEDQYEQDMKVFKQRFPVLNSVTVKKDIFLPFDKERAVAWWKKQ